MTHLNHLCLAVAGLMQLATAVPAIKQAPLRPEAVMFLLPHSC